MTRLNPDKISAYVSRNHRLCFTLLLGLGVLLMIAYGSLKSSVSFHIDELWQYSFSNSNGKLTNAVERSDYGKWLPGTVFRDYISVQPGERFSYGPIAGAVHRDVHPPMSHFLLHTTSSFFPNQFSKWLGVGTNIVTYACTMVLLYLLANALFASRVKALIATGLWAFSLGAVDTVMYIRLYCLLTFFSVALALCAVNVMKGRGQGYLLLAYFTYIFGGLTDYIFWIFGFYITLAFVLMRWNRNMRQAIAFAAVSLAGFITTCGLFPATVMQFFNRDSLSNRAINDFNVMDRVRQFFDFGHVMNRLLEYTADRALLLPACLVFGLLTIAGLAVLAMLVITLVIALAAALISELPEHPRQFLSGDSHSINNALWDKAKRVMVKAYGLFVDNLKRMLAAAGRFYRARPVACFLALAVFLTAYTLATIFPDFQIWTLRAFFFLFPFFSLLLAAGLFFLHERVKVPAVILAGLVLVLLARDYVVVRTPFLFRKGYEKVAEKTAGTDVIFVLDSEDSMMRVTNFCVALAGARNVYLMIIDGPAYRQQIADAVATSANPNGVMVINTIGTPPYNETAGKLIGFDFLLHHDATLMADLAARGYHLGLEKQGAQLFQWFNLYKISPIAR